MDNRSSEEKIQDAGAPEPSEIVLQRSEYENLMKRLEELEGLREKLMRSAADFENAKKRLARERDDFVKFSQENFIRSILPVLDNFERALTHAQAQQQESPALKNLVSGIQMIHKQFLDTLKGQGLSRIQSLGELFDPHKHEAIAHIPETGPEDVVIQEHEAGYMLHDRLLRAAKVNVRVAPAPSNSQEAP
ncbi:MAG: nucleotide exchange factor GrpE [Candidatus Omnitrophica bacterium]|nr:nucleotide exchange factor GrpE [Candidatus Omnitrophota bacterium]